jgi:hypothetical protein
VLVLPAAAAQELQQHWQQAAAAAAATEEAKDAGDACSLSSTWHSTVGPLTTDIAYVLSACKDTSNWPDTAAAAAAAAGSQLPEGIRAVLQQLLTHQAACGMWATMQMLVTCATEAAAAASAAAAAAAGTKAADQELMSKCSSSVTAGDTPAASSSSSSSNAACDAGSCSRSSSGPLKPPSSSPAATATAAAEGHVSQVPGRPLAGFAVPATSLLWGFENRQLEDSYQAAAFSSSQAMDVATLVYAAAVGLTCYYTKGSSSQQQQGLAPVLLFRSQVIALFVCVAGPIAVLVHRWRVARKLQALRQQQQQQGMTATANNSAQRACRAFFEACAGANSSPAAAAGNSSSSSGYAALAQHAEQLLVSAARTKHQLLLCWLLLILVWGFIVLLGGCGLIAEPFIVMKQWQQIGWSANLASLVGFALKGWTTQVSLFILAMRSSTMHFNVRNLTSGTGPADDSAHEVLRDFIQCFLCCLGVSLSSPVAVYAQPRAVGPGSEPGLPALLVAELADHTILVSN